MRTMITGGSGFIAAWIMKRLLLAGHDVVAFDVRPSTGVAELILREDASAIEWRQGDVSKASDVDECARDCNLLIHLAAILTPACQAQPVRGAEINLIGTLNVFEAARKFSIGKVLYMSSAGVFGTEHANEPYPETLYGAFKLACEGAARAYWIDHKIASVGFRPLVVYGPGRETGLTAGPSLACKAAASGSDYTIPFSGRSDFVYVEDVADAFAEIAKADLAGADVFNIAGEIMDTVTLAREIEAAAPGVTIRIEGPVLPVAADVPAGALREVYPAIPRTGVSEGVRRTVEHSRQVAIRTS